MTRRQGTLHKRVARCGTRRTLFFFRVSVQPWNPQDISFPYHGHPEINTIHSFVALANLRSSINHAIPLDRLAVSALANAPARSIL